MRRAGSFSAKAGLELSASQGWAPLTVHSSPPPPQPDFNSEVRKRKARRTPLPEQRETPGTRPWLATRAARRRHSGFNRRRRRAQKEKAGALRKKKKGEEKNALLNSKTLFGGPARDSAQDARAFRLRDRKPETTGGACPRSGKREHGDVTWSDGHVSWPPGLGLAVRLRHSGAGRRVFPQRFLRRERARRLCHPPHREQVSASRFPGPRGWREGEGFGRGRRR